MGARVVLMVYRLILGRTVSAMLGILSGSSLAAAKALEWNSIETRYLPGFSENAVCKSAVHVLLAPGFIRIKLIETWV